MQRLKLLRIPTVLIVLILSLQCQFTIESENNSTEDNYSTGVTSNKKSIDATYYNDTIDIFIRKHLSVLDYLPMYNDEEILIITCADEITLNSFDIRVINDNILVVNSNIKKVIFRNGLQPSYDERNYLVFINIESLTLPDNVNSLSDFSIFSRSLKEINIGAGTNNITSKAFNSLVELISINVSKSNLSYSDDHGSLYTENFEKLVSVPKKAMGELIINSKTEYIFPYAINDCQLLSKVIIPSGVKQLETNTIYNCRSINEVVLSDTINDLQLNSFNYCINLSKLVFNNPTPIVVTERFFSVCPINEIRVPDLSLILYEKASVWSSIKDNIFAFSDTNTPTDIMKIDIATDLIRPIIEINNSNAIEVVPYQLYLINFDETTDYCLLKLKTDSLLSDYSIYIIDSYNISFFPELSDEYEVGRAVFFQCRTGDSWENSYSNKYIYREREIHRESGTYGGITPEKPGPVIYLEPETDNTILYISPYMNMERYLGKYLFFFRKNRI